MSTDHTKAIVHVAHLLRERDALVRMCERLAMFAAHAEGCKGDEFQVHQCTCGMAGAADDAVKLCEGIREGWR